MAAISRATLTRIDRAAGELSTAATRQMEGHDWYRALPAQSRSWAGLVAQAGIGAFIDWLRSGSEAGSVSTEIFDTAPRDLQGVISLAQTIDLVRTVVDVVERDAVALASDREQPALRESILRYSREVAFAAAQVYAVAAESRGAWDARLEGLVVDAVLRGEADESMQSRAAALGWGSTKHVAVIVGGAPAGQAAEVIDQVHRAATREGIDVLAAVQGGRCICIVGEVEDGIAVAVAIVEQFAPGPVVVGPTVPHLFASGRSARAAVSGHSAAPAWPDAPRPVRAGDLLAERALVGDLPARAELLDRVWAPLNAGDGHLLATASAYLDSGRVLERTARALFVHANTVRYRIGSIAKETGYLLTEPHDAFTVSIALAFGRLGRGAAQRPRL